MDTLSKKERSERMSRIRLKDTKPELVVRRLIHGLGYRYRLHDRHLPGHPDLVFKGRGKIIFIHGCFWHLHAGCANNRPPKTRRDFWMPKLEGNRARDKREQAKLRKLGWRIMVIWECQLADTDRLTKRIQAFLEKS